MKKINASKVVLGIVAIGIVSLATLGIASSTNKNSHHQVLQVVAAENFWGSLVSQLGGSHVHVVSVVSDPNADPHEYESNTTTAKEFATADYVVVNGAGYDSWANKLLSADSNSNRKVLTIADLLGKKEGDNPHFWYNPDYVNQSILQMKQDLTALDPSDSTYFQQQYRTLLNSLLLYEQRIAALKVASKGVKVAATEDIFQYLSDAAGLDLISPEEFTQAVAEGNDPSAASVVTFQNQLQSKQPKVLVYNEQTVTPLTESIKHLAQANNIPIVGITETIQPPNVSFQDWMNAEIVSIQNALTAH